MKQATLLFAGMLATSGVLAQEPQMPDNFVPFTEILNNEYRMPDWSEELLKREIAKNGSNVDRLRVQLAATYFKQSKDAEGNAVIALVTSASPAYADAQMALGVVMFNKGRYDDAAKYLEAWRAVYKAKYAKTLPDMTELEWYRKNFGYLLQLYIAQKNIPKIRECANELADLEVAVQKAIMAKLGPDEDPPSLSGSNIRLFGMKAALDVLNERKNSGTKIVRSDVDDIVKSLEKLFWADGNIRDIAAMQKARAFVLVGDAACLKLAEQTFKQFKENIDAWEEKDDEGNAAYSGETLKYSPKASYRHYYGLYRKALGDAATDVAVKKKEYGAALSSLYSCLKVNEGYEETMDVFNNLLDILDKVEAMGSKKPLDPNTDPVLAKISRGQSAISDKARNDYEKKDYDKAIPEFHNGYNRNPNAEDAESLLAQLADAYANIGKTLEGAAVATLATERFPHSDRAANVLLIVGAKAFDRQKALPKGPEKDALMNDVLQAYGTLLRYFPAHPSAPTAAFLLANDKMTSAGIRAKEAVAESAQLKKVRLIEESVNLYREAADNYNTIIENFRQKPEIVNNAYFYKGICLSSASDFIASNAAFTDYCKAETKDIEKLANAKYMIGDNYRMEAERLEKDAKALYARAGRAGEEDAKVLNVEADSMMVSAKANYLLSAKAFEDFANNYYAKELKSSTEPKVLTYLSLARLNIGLMYDGAGEKKTAIKTLDGYLKSTGGDAASVAKNAPVVYSRIAILYAEVNDANNAAKYLAELVEKYPTSPQSKEARYFLGTSMYNIKQYDKAVEAFTQMFKESEGKKGRNVAAWTWILNNMITYPDRDDAVSPAMAKVAVQAGKLLTSAMDADLTNLQNPNGKDWFTAEGLAASRKVPGKVLNDMRNVQERLWLNLGKACYLAQMYQEAVDNFTKLVDPPRNKTRAAGTKAYTSGFKYDGLLNRARAYAGLKKYDEAHKDLSELILLSLSASRFDIQREAICEQGDIYISAKQYKSAFDAFSQIVSNDNLKERPEVNYPADCTPAEKKAIDEQAEIQFQKELKFIEYAAYRYAYCAALLGLTKERDEMVAKYKKNFGTGRYGRELTRLPAPEAANKP